VVGRDVFAGVVENGQYCLYSPIPPALSSAFSSSGPTYRYISSTAIAHYIWCASGGNDRKHGSRVVLREQSLCVRACSYRLVVVYPWWRWRRGVKIGLLNGGNKGECYNSLGGVETVMRYLMWACVDTWTAEEQRPSAFTNPGLGCSCFPGLDSVACGFHASTRELREARSSPQAISETPSLKESWGDWLDDLETLAYGTRSLGVAAVCGLRGRIRPVVNLPCE
jgi:hypothetical protein